MSSPLPTVLLRLEGPLQAWGTTSRHGVRATDNVPSKSGVSGLICSALGLRRGAVGPWLAKLNRLTMGVRIDRPGRVLMDFHTAGAKIGLMSAEGKIKYTSTTGEIEPQVSRCYYLEDASFLVALQGDEQTIREIEAALSDPVWPPFLGRKSCPPALPVFVDRGEFASLTEALASYPWQPRTEEECKAAEVSASQVQLNSVIETDSSEPASYRIPDVALSFAPPTYRFRYVAATTISEVKVDDRYLRWNLSWRPHTEPGSARWKDIRLKRLDVDRGLCVFCKGPAKHVHHVTYEKSPFEELEHLRSVCALCHDALSMIEYSEGRTEKRVDPFDKNLRARIIRARQTLLNNSVPLRIRRRGD